VLSTTSVGLTPEILRPENLRRTAYPFPVGSVPEREPITPDNWCEVADRWTVAVDTMQRVASAADLYGQRTGRPVWIISGFRTDAEQNALRRSGRPTARNDLSTHLSCPATGVDISLGFAPSRFEIVTWGEIAMTQGLRWGGGGRVRELPGPGIPLAIPVDWQHVDRGARN